MATDTEVHRPPSPPCSRPSPNIKQEQCYIPWVAVDWHSNRSPIPEVKDGPFDYNSHSWYTINHPEYSDMGPISYPVGNGIEANNHSSYPSYRPSPSASPVPDRRNSIYRPAQAPAPPMNVVSSNVSPGLPSQRKSHYAPSSLGSPNLYGTSPRTSNIPIGNGSVHTQFPSQLVKYNELNPISENHTPSSLPSSFAGTPPTPLAPPAMNRTHSGTILKSSDRRLYNPAAGHLPQISFQQNSPDAPAPGEIKEEYEPAPPTLFSHNSNAYHKHEFDHGIQTMYPIALPGMGPVHSTPYTNGAAPNTYFASSQHTIDGVPTQGLLTDAFGEPSGHSFRKRDYNIMEGYPQWPSPDSLQMQKPAKRRKSSANQPWQLSEDDRFLIKLKDEEQLPWKEIVVRFKEDGRGTHRVPALQMRLKRIKERIRQWTPEDVNHHQYPPLHTRCYPVRQPPLLIRASG
ncbi:hypothetical protein ABW21_db0206371 [Orbilia brochopaga]|nr:hypothetical protein ABW21_db0206371 [Drechslerella brochopaga]